MKLPYRTFLRAALIVSIALVSISFRQPAKADAPAITVTAVWRPGTQLSTIDTGIHGQTDQAGDDLRYVDLELDVTTSVEFWATEITCTVNPGVLESYVQNTDYNVTGVTGDHFPVVTWGPSWKVSQATLQQPFNTVNGSMTIDAANPFGSPLGHNMITTSFPLATIRYRVRTVRAATTSPVTCSGSFLNTDGTPVLTPSFVMPPSLMVIPGYTISGIASYEGRTAKSGIGVLCSQGLLFLGATTNANGVFRIATRVQGPFQCAYYGNTSLHQPLLPDLYLQATTKVTLNGLSYTLLPVTLFGGNLTYAGGDKQVDGADVALVTSNFGLTPLGDANGDGKTDKSDLSIVAGNFGLIEPTDATHILYGLTNGPVTNGSRIWVGLNQIGATRTSAKVTQLLPGSNVDNWPALSPDGSRLVVTRQLGTAPNYRYALFIMNANGTGTATQLTPTTGINGNYDAFAASWSPDGSQIAFDCAPVPASFSWMLDRSSLCVIDSAGHGYRVLGLGFRVFPPAWVDNLNVLVAANHDAGIGLDNTLYEVNTQSGAANLYPLMDSSATFVDMPVISDGALFYRVGPGPFFFRRWAILDGNGNVINPFPTITGPNYHYGVSADGTPFMMVRPGGRDIIEVDDTGDFYYYLQYNAGTWSIASYQYTVQDSVANPYWDDIQGDSSYIYGLRNTFTWVP